MLGVIKITDELTLTAISLFEDAKLNTLRDITNLSRILRALRNEYNRKILIALQKARMSTVFDLKRITGAPNKEIIQGKVITLTSYGFVDIKHKNSDDYWIYRRYWKQQHPNSHGDPDFLVPTEYAQRIYDAYTHAFEDLLPAPKLSSLESFGHFFKQFYQNQMEQLGDDDQLPEPARMKVVGSCHVCGEQLFSTAQYEEFEGRLYCQECKYELYKDKRYLKETP